ncbi:MAG TPA: hypothetical protein VHE34_14965 [Puia sp.]|uniref:TetR family transcriptional regulator C-terminal domain-containing protein n=1 Tax=Puia sp. TaxID=2045100 RepID=UPI002C025D5F|nr:hypothetical protein [Puia sp.]HVU96527.1 hypothetical protein [Puia sp.]
MNKGEQTRQMIDLYRNPMNPPLEGGCPMLNFGMEADEQNEVIREKVAGKVNQSQQPIVNIIDRGDPPRGFQRGLELQGIRDDGIRADRRRDPDRQNHPEER